VEPKKLVEYAIFVGMLATTVVASRLAARH